MNYYINVPYYPMVYPYQMPNGQYRNYTPANMYYNYPPYYNHHFHTVPEYYIEEDNYFDRQDRIITLQNLGESPYKNSYLDIDGNTGRVILSQGGSGIHWRLRRHSDGVVTLQNLGESPYKNSYLDIDGNTGRVILSQGGSGIYWRLRRHSDGVVTLQNLGESPYKNSYLDINGNTGRVILSQAGSGIYWRLGTSRLEP
ncbi:TPA: hypothetical protein QC063_004503 [Bacillus cereus]|nr:hypothetical protein [Bacillus cereus]